MPSTEPELRIDRDVQPFGLVIALVDATK